MQPGQTIHPGEQTPPPQEATPQPEAAPLTEPQSSLPPQTTPSEEQPLPQPVPASEQPLEPEANWQFKGEEYGSNFQPQFSDDPITWTASEFVSHEKNASWYLLVIVSSVVVAALVYLITKDWVSAVALVTVGVAFAAFGARKPRVLEYGIDAQGVHIGPRSYTFDRFRTFSVIEEDAIRSILLMPMQRFNLPINVYYDPADEDKIIEALGAYLPHQDRKPAAVDNFMRKIRF